MKYAQDQIVRKYVETPYSEKSIDSAYAYRVPMTQAKAFTELKDGSIVDEDDLEAVVQTVKALITVLKVAADQGHLNPERLEAVGSIVNKLCQIVR